VHLAVYSESVCRARKQVLNSRSWMSKWELGGERSMVTERPWVHLQRYELRNIHINGAYLLLGNLTGGKYILSQELVAWFRREQRHTCINLISTRICRTDSLIAGSMVLFGFLMVTFSPGLWSPKLAHKGYPLVIPCANTLCLHLGWVIMETIIIWARQVPNCPMLSFPLKETTQSCTVMRSWLV
jgi:hypothetical protein